MGKFNNFLRVFKENLLVSSLDTFFSLCSGGFLIHEVSKKNILEKNNMEFFITLLDICVALAPFVILWSFFHLLLKFDQHKKEVVQQFQELKQETLKNNQKTRKELFEVARLVKVLYTIQREKDINTEKGEYSTSLKLLRGNIDYTDLTTLLKSAKINLDDDKVILEKKVFESINHHLSILEDDDIRTIIKNIYNKENAPAK